MPETTSTIRFRGLPFFERVMLAAGAARDRISGSRRFYLPVVALLVLGLAACQSESPTAAPTPTTSTTPTTSPTRSPLGELSLTELKYHLTANFGGIFFCDPDFYPIAREGQEQRRALEEFANIQQDAERFRAILNHLGLLEASTYTEEEQLLVYREHKMLNAVQLAPSQDAFAFELRVDEGQGLRIQGTVDSTGEITVTEREPNINTCPICLAEDVRIGTPLGEIMIKDLRVGMETLTVDSEGERAVAVVKVIASAPAPMDHLMVSLVLDDGRTLLASPGHPLADGRTLAELEKGDLVDGARVVDVERTIYSGKATYDLLPSGETGRYWAGGIPLASTLSDGRSCSRDAGRRGG